MKKWKNTFARHSWKRILAFYFGLHGALMKHQFRYFLFKPNKPKKTPPHSLEYWLGLKISNPNKITVASKTTPVEFYVGNKTRHCISLRIGGCFYYKSVWTRKICIGHVLKMLPKKVLQQQNERYDRAIALSYRTGSCKQIDDYLKKKKNTQHKLTCNFNVILYVMNYAELWQIKHHMTSYCIHSVMWFTENLMPHGYMLFS